MPSPRIIPLVAAGKLTVLVVSDTVVIVAVVLLAAGYVGLTTGVCSASLGHQGA